MRGMKKSYDQNGGMWGRKGSCNNGQSISASRCVSTDIKGCGNEEGLLLRWMDEGYLIRGAAVEMEECRVSRGAAIKEE